jgi:hypothetical protein
VEPRPLALPLRFPVIEHVFESRADGPPPQPPNQMDPEAPPPQPPSKLNPVRRRRSHRTRQDHFPPWAPQHTARPSAPAR